MLTNLHVKNIALIDEIDVEFERGLNIFTGETGAGKSLLLGSINLALGKKMTRETIGKFGNYALVELSFTVENPALETAFAQMGIQLEDDQVILSRKIMEGRSVSRINGETCTVGQMKKAATLLWIFTVSTSISPCCIRRNSWIFWMNLPGRNWRLSKTGAGLL